MSFQFLLRKLEFLCYITGCSKLKVNAFCSSGGFKNLGWISMYVSLLFLKGLKKHLQKKMLGTKKVSFLGAAGS